MIYPCMVDLSSGYTQDIEAGSSLCHTPVLAWSPDSQFLSLARPASETSWSVSIMEIETGTIRIAAADLGPVKKLAWSPGGEWLLVHANQAGSNCKEGLPDDTDISLYAVPSDSSAALPRSPIFTGSGWFEAGWLTSDHYLIDHRLNGGRADLRMYALQTGQEIRLWPQPFYSLTFDPEQEKVLVSGSLNPDRDPRAGLYTFNRFGQMNRLSETGFNGLQFIGGAQVRWAAFRLEGLIGIGADGVYFPISPHNRGQILPSPDRQWFLVYGEDGADLFTNNGDLVAGLTEHSTSAVLWQPDSAGVIVSSEEGLLYMPVPPAPPIHVNCSLIDCRLSLEAAVWIP